MLRLVGLVAILLAPSASAQANLYTAEPAFLLPSEEVVQLRGEGNLSLPVGVQLTIAGPGCEQGQSPTAWNWAVGVAVARAPSWLVARFDPVTLNFDGRCGTSLLPTTLNLTRQQGAAGNGTVELVAEASAGLTFFAGNGVYGRNTTTLRVAVPPAANPGPGTILGNGPPVSTSFDPWVLVPLAGILVGGMFAVAALRKKSTPVAPPPPPGPPTAGAAFLGKYLVERELGRGAFGTTWLARHAKLERSAVIKQLASEWTANEEARGRFQREAKILAALDHPSVTRIYDVEEVAGAWYIVMEYVDGGTLDERLAHGPLPWEEARPILLDVLAGLVYVHGRGILHRDLKPSNVLLQVGGGAKVADFGIARSQSLQLTRLTTTGSPPGTPHYMAPEHVAGKEGDARSDLYAAAALAYRTLTGRFYVQPEPEGYLSLLRAVAEFPPTLPVEGLPPALNEWLARGLAKGPEERFQSADEMRAALDAIPSPWQARD